MEPNRPPQERRRSTLRRIGAMSVAALLSPLLMIQPLGAITITSINDVDITQVVLNDSGTVVTQTASGAGAVVAGSTPVDLVEITINDGGTAVVLDEFTAGSSDAYGFSYPTGLTGVRTWENGVATELADSGFETALERVLDSTDLRDYLAYDSTSLAGSTWNPDFDVMFTAPLYNDDYIVVTERNGNTFFDLIPLDVNGNPIPGHEVVAFDAGYGWNTNYAPAEFNTQPQWITVADVENFDVDTTTTPIWGFRVDNDGEADVKFFAAADEPFTAPVPSSISGTVLDDLGNPIPNVTIVLSVADASGTSNVIMTVLTDDDGNYSFADLEPGEYTVTENQPIGYTDANDVVGSEGGDDSVNDVFSSIILGSGVDAVDYDFIETTASISGTVFTDVDQDGTQGPSEPGISGVTMTLTGTDVLGNPVNATTTTDANGDYSFEGLLTGNYTVTETQPANYEDGQDTAGSLGGDNSVNDVISSIILSGAASSVDNDFGEFEEEDPVAPLPAPTTLTGTVWIDSNGDGVIDPAETNRLEGVEIELYDASGTLVATTTTDADGNYSFTDLTVGDYTVVELQPDAYGTTSPNSLDVSVPTSGLSNVDFGELPGTVEGVVWRDADSDGQFDAGETAVSGVTVRLLDSAGNVVAATTTNADGEYLFTDLPAGDYSVRIVPPTGDDLTVPNQGSDTTDSDFAVATSAVAITLEAGGSVTDVDAGLVAEPVVVTAPPELALTGVESWQLTTIAMLLIAAGFMQTRLAKVLASSPSARRED